MNTTTIIKTIQDIMRKDAGIDGDAQRLSQLVWMIFLKIFDACEQEYESVEKNYQSPIPEALRWRSWAIDIDGITGDDLIHLLNQKLIPSLTKLALSSEPHTCMVGRVFEDTHNYMRNGSLIRQVINKLNEINFNRAKDRHQFGEIYEKILKDLQSAGNAGEFYTPRAITQFAVDRLKPKLGERILDPACGTGGFLTAAIDYICKNNKGKDVSQTLQDTILGIEKKALPYHLCITNLLLHGIRIPRVEHKNTLAESWQDISFQDQVDIILTNPPFGGMEEDGIEKNFREPYRIKETAQLFLERIVDLLKDGGRAAIVLPDGALYGEGAKIRIRKKLLSECNLHTVVRLPGGVFNPYTNISTNLLFLNKGDVTKKIWYFEHPYPPGYKSYSKTKPIQLKEFGLENDWWDNREENEFSWKVSISDLKDNEYNLDIKNPSFNNISYGNFDQILHDYQNLKHEFDEIQNELKFALLKCLKDEV